MQYVCGTERSISLTDSSKAGSLKSISDPVPDKVDSKTDRFNDGICDAKGRMLAGTMCVFSFRC
jgi:sugar lactone lactonase YvrE